MNTRYKKGTFMIVPNKKELMVLKSDVQALFMWLCAFADDDGVCWPSRNTLAKHAHCSVKKIDRNIAILIKEGFISKEIRKKGKTNLSNVYQIMLKGGDDLSLPSDSLDATPTPKNDTVTVSNLNSTNEYIADKSAKNELFEILSYYLTLVKNTEGFKPEVSKAGAARIKQLIKHYTKVEIKDMIYFFLSGKKAREFGVDLSTALSTHSINQWLANKN